MKKAAAAAIVVFVFMFLMTIISTVSGGESSAPIATPTTVEHASDYFAISNEIGVPWDLILLVDTILSDQEGKADILDINPLVTSLNFAYVEMIIEASHETEKSTIWEEVGRQYFYGYNDICGLLGVTNTDTIADVARKIQKYEEQAKSDTSKVTLFIYSVGPESYREVIETYYGDRLEPEMIDDIITLWESQYLYHLYFDEVLRHEGADFTGFDVPEVTVGDVTRRELVEVSISLINRPYLFGGKSPHIGPPKSLLDCSGYVDWVYMQCFGETVSRNQGGTTAQYAHCVQISQSELKPGDLGFYYSPSNIPSGQYNHVGIYIGEIDGKPAFAHCGGPYWGYAGSESGRVVVSVNDKVTVTTTTPIGGVFSPPMNPSNFVIFMRPQFRFSDDVDDEEWEYMGED